jgi:hypothetical protein
MSVAARALCCLQLQGLLLAALRACAVRPPIHHNSEHQQDNAAAFARPAPTMSGKSGYFSKKARMPSALAATTPIAASAEAGGLKSPTLSGPRRRALPDCTSRPLALALRSRLLYLEAKRTMPRAHAGAYAHPFGPELHSRNLLCV